MDLMSDTTEDAPLRYILSLNNAYKHLQMI
jgi:hypothetical protein